MGKPASNAPTLIRTMPAGGPDLAILHESPTFEVHVGAIATPAVIRTDPPDEVAGALYDRSGRLIRLSERTGGLNGARFPSRNPDSLPPAGLETPEERNGRTLYLGHHMPHYGHFIVECLPVMWMHREFDRFDRFAFHPFTFGTRRPRFMADAYEAIGIPVDRIELITRPMRFEEVTVPERLVRYRCTGNVHAREVYRRLVEAFAAAEAERASFPRRIYFSRLRNSLRKATRAVINEAAIERAMVRRGFAVVYPELLPLAEQVRLAANAEVLCGLEGSAMHNVVFARPGTTVISIGDARSDESLDPMQAILVALAEADGHYIPFRGRVIDRRSRVAWVDVGAVTSAIDAIVPPEPVTTGARTGMRPSRAWGLWLGTKTAMRLAKWRFSGA